VILSQEIWLLALSAYFARRALISFRRRLTATITRFDLNE
jgi:hypothetical protein